MNSVGVDVVPATGGAALSADSPALMTLAQTAPAGMDFSDLIALGPVTISFVNLLLDDALSILQSVEIPTSPQVTNFEGVLNIPGVLPQRVKIDLSDFDLDNDGQTEGGTGCACPVACDIAECPRQAPAEDLRRITYRVWIEDPETLMFEPFMAGFFEILPVRDDPETPENEENAGQGRFRLGFVEPFSKPSGETVLQSLSFGVTYDHQDSSDPFRKSTEMLVQDIQYASSTSEPPLEETLFHALAAQETPVGVTGSEGLTKTAKLDMRTSPPPFDDPNVVRYIGRFIDDLDFWSGSVFFSGNMEGVPTEITFENLCALISTGFETDRGNCQDLGIDVAGEEFLEPATPSDVVLPMDFPLTPPF